MSDQDEGGVGLLPLLLVWDVLSLSETRIHIFLVTIFLCICIGYQLLTYVNLHSDLIRFYASSEAWRKEMWQDRSPSEEEADQLAQCFEYEWTQAVDTMLRHWPNTPTWY